MLTTDNSRFKNRTDHPLSHYGLLISHQIVLLRKRTTAANFSFYWNGSAQLLFLKLLNFRFTVLCFYSLFIILYWAQKSSNYRMIFLRHIIQAKGLNRSRSPCSTSQLFYYNYLATRGYVNPSTSPDPPIPCKSPPLSSQNTSF